MLEIATLILAIATIFLAVGAFKDRLFKPSIHIYVQSNAAFCQPICWEKPALANGYLFLVAIKNTHTWITARNVQIITEDLFEIHHDEQMKRVNYFNKADLEWSHCNDIFTDIFPGLTRYINLGRTMDPEKRGAFNGQQRSNLLEGKTSFVFAHKIQRLSKNHIVPHGKYKLDLVIGGSNIKTKRISLIIDITGKWENTVERMLDVGFKINISESEFPMKLKMRYFLN